MHPAVPFRTIGTGVFSFLGAALIAGIAIWKRPAPLPVLRDPGKLLAAARSYARDRSHHGGTPPPEVSLSELVATGYVSPGDVAAFAGMEAAISLNTEEEQPQSIRFWARGQDGITIALLGDGSIQQLPAARFETLRREALEVAPPKR